VRHVPPRQVDLLPRGFLFLSWLALAGMEADLAPRGHSRGHSHEAVERPGVRSDNGAGAGPIGTSPPPTENGARRESGATRSIRGPLCSFQRKRAPALVCDAAALLTRGDGRGAVSRAWLPVSAPRVRPWAAGAHRGGRQGGAGAREAHTIALLRRSGRSLDGTSVRAWHPAHSRAGAVGALRCAGPGA
jgi:hypothetical protein